MEVQDLIDKTSAGFKPAIQFCYRVALRSFLRHNGYNSLPKTNLQYVSHVWHRSYKRSEIQTLLDHLKQKVHKLFVVMDAESGLRSHVLMELRYRHVMEDLDCGTIPAPISTLDLPDLSFARLRLPILAATSSGSESRSLTKTVMGFHSRKSLQVRRC